MPIVGAWRNEYGLVISDLVLSHFILVSFWSLSDFIHVSFSFHSRFILLTDLGNYGLSVNERRLKELVPSILPEIFDRISHIKTIGQQDSFRCYLFSLYLDFLPV